MFRHSTHPLIRCTALFAVLCVVALSVFAASPELHDGLHGEEETQHALPIGDDEHVCAVTLFASGAEALLVFCLLLLGRSAVRSFGVRTVDEFATTQPRYWLVPSHAPPLV